MKAIILLPAWTRFMVNSVIKMTILDAMDKIKTAKSISIALLSSGVHSSASFLGSFLVYLLINWSMKPIFLSFKSPLKLYYNLQLKIYIKFIKNIKQNLISTCCPVICLGGIILILRLHRIIMLLFSLPGCCLWRIL